MDVDAAAAQGRFPRAEAVRRLQQWNDSGAIELKQSGVINCFKVLQTFPTDGRVQDTVAGIVLQQFEEKEAQDMLRLRSVIDFVTTKGCLARELAKHFGDEDSVPNTGCTICNFCVTKKAVEYLPGDAKSEASNIDENKIQAILAATSIHDDARFLARVAYGITSPRITAEKLSKHHVFGCMAKCNFEVSLLASREIPLAELPANADRPHRNLLHDSTKYASKGPAVVGLSLEILVRPALLQTTLLIKAICTFGAVFLSWCGRPYHRYHQSPQRCSRMWQAE